jgi:hypothetical protein
VPAPPARRCRTNGEGRRMRTMFAVYWVLVLGGIVFYLVVGVTHA